MSCLSNMLPKEYEDIQKRLTLDLNYIIKIVLANDLIKPNSCILDIGCGTGDLCEELQRCRDDITVFGIDSNAKLSAYFEQRSTKHVRFSISDADNLPFGNGSIHLICARMVLSLLSPEARKGIYSEIRRLLTEEGSFVVYENMDSELRTAQPIRSQGSVLVAAAKMRRYLPGDRLAEIMQELQALFDVTAQVIIKDSYNPGNGALEDYYCFSDEEKKNLKDIVVVRSGCVDAELLLNYDNELRKYLQGGGYAMGSQIILVCKERKSI